MSDVFGPARRFRMLCMIDDYTREHLALVADTSHKGTELTSRAILEWQNQTGIA